MGNPAQAPSEIISLPQGGGALGGMSETFTPDGQTGTGNMTIPLVVPPGRRGLEPKPELLCSTGSGNGLLGLGWSLSVPGATRIAGLPPRCGDLALRSNLRRRQTPVFGNVLRELRGSPQLALGTTPGLARRYAEYFEDVGSLNLAILACTRVNRWTPNPDKGKRLCRFGLLVAASQASGKLCWSSCDLSSHAAQSRHAHGFWRQLDGPAAPVLSIAATTHRPASPVSQPVAAGGGTSSCLRAASIGWGLACRCINHGRGRPQDLAAPADPPRLAPWPRGNRRSR